MTLGIIKRTTPNFSFRIPFFDAPNWGREMERNFDTIDAVLFAATGFTNVKGVWTNNTEYDASDRVVDPADGSVWQANVSHTSASTGTFEDDRTLHPTYWTQLSQTVGFRGQWTTATNYNINEFLYDDHRYGATLTKYTSGATYDADVAAGKILTLIDLRDAYDDTQDAAAAAAVSAAAALVSETNADASEAQALIYKNQAATSASNAATSETNAAASALAANNSQVAALSSELNAAANGLIVSMFVFSTTVSYPPPAGQIRTNNANQTLATRLDVNHLNTGNVDVTQIFLLQVQAGTLILLQDRSTPANYQIYTATGPAVVSGSDLQIPVVWKSGGTAIANNRPTLFGIGGGGGAASVTTDDNPPAPPLRDGQLWFKSSTGVFYVYYDDGNSQQWVQISAAPQVAAQNTRNRGHIDPGFNLANDTGDATNDIVIPTGVVASDVSPYPLMAHTQTIRQLDFAYGVNNGDRLGGRFDSAISDGWWRVFVIGNGTLVQSGMSKSADPTTQPNYPAGYTAYRRVGWILRSGGVIQAFFQDGDDYEWQSINSDFSVSNPGTAVVLRTLSAPPNTIAHVQFNFVCTDTTPVVPFYVYRTDLVARNFPVAVAVNASGRNQQQYGEFTVKVDSVSQVKTQVTTSTAGISTQAATMGWKDTRGRV